MLNIEVVFKFKEKEIKSINSKENDNVYEIFNKNIDLKELKLNEYQLYYEEKFWNSYYNFLYLIGHNLNY